MSLQVFFDTSAIVALAIRRDQSHAAAVDELERLQERRADLVTSTDVLDEAVTYLRRKAGQAAAIEVGEALRTGEAASLLSVDDDARTRAWAIFRRYRDVPLSLTDCTSIAMMRRFRIGEVFSFDSDFDRVGLVRRPR